jgi:hypothetical protein
MHRLNGLDQYSGSSREVLVNHDEAHVWLSVEAGSGSNTGEAMLTPVQARAVAEALNIHALSAEVHDQMEVVTDV